MCMLIAFVQRGPIGFVATGTFFRNESSGRTYEGRKVTRLRDGWVVSAGCGKTGWLTSSALLETGISRPENVRSALLRSHKRQAARRREDGFPVPRTDVVALHERASGLAAYRVGTDGRITSLDSAKWRPGEAEFRPGFPNGVGAVDRERLINEWVPKIMGSASLEGLIRSVSGLLGATHQATGIVGERAEFGLTIAGRPLFLEAPTNWLVSASDSEIFRSLKPPPAPVDWKDKEYLDVGRTSSAR